jgi:DNA polymerase I-like protein with 3'-5' exonuclease and polymerase domains
MVLQRELHIEKIAPHVDGIFLKRAVQSETSHGLGYVGSIWTDVPAWKAAHRARDNESPAERREYNGTDLAVTNRVIEPLFKHAKDREQLPAVRVHHRVQEMCVGLHRMGMLVHEPTRRRLDGEYRTRAVDALKALRIASGDSTLNPQSIPQLRSLLFDHWNLPVRRGYTTKAGDPSTNDDAMRMLTAEVTGKKIRLGTIRELEVLSFLKALRKFRKACKARGTYIRKLIPWDRQILHDDLEDDDSILDDEGIDSSDEDRVDALKRKKKGATRWGVLDPRDGRFHSDFNAHTPATQRISSSNPNAQNFIRALRQMVIPGPGHRFVYADSSQLELRFAACLWGLSVYIQAFQDPRNDPHNLSAELVFGEVYKALCKSENPTDQTKKEQLRDFAKRFTYAVLYGAQIETIHEVITSAESGDELPFAHVKIGETEQAYYSWTGAVPQIVAGWDKTLATFGKQGYLQEPILGFRRDFSNAGGDKDVRNEELNFQCQAGGAALIHLASINLIDNALPFHYEAHRGMVNQSHDAMTFEEDCTCTPFTKLNKKGKEVEAHEEKCKCMKAAHAMEEAMTITPTAMCNAGSLKKGQKFPVTFRAEAKVVTTWC